MRAPKSPFKVFCVVLSVCHFPVFKETWFQSRTSLFGICGGQSGTGSTFPLHTSVSPWRYHSTNLLLMFHSSVVDTVIFAIDIVTKKNTEPCPKPCLYSCTYCFAFIDWKDM